MGKKSFLKWVLKEIRPKMGKKSFLKWVLKEILCKMGKKSFLKWVLKDDSSLLAGADANSRFVTLFISC